MRAMDKTTALARVREAHDAIAQADREAERIKRDARVRFGQLVNEVVSDKTVMQEEVAAEVNKTREYVRRLQVTARKA